MEVDVGDLLLDARAIGGLQTGNENLNGRANGGGHSRTADATLVLRLVLKAVRVVLVPRLMLVGVAVGVVVWGVLAAVL